MKKILERNSITVAIVVVIILILIGSTLTIYNRRVMERALSVKVQTSFAKSNSEDLVNIIRQMDISARGYALTKVKRFFFYDVARAGMENEQVFRKYDSLFKVQGYKPTKTYDSVRAGMHEYVRIYDRMVSSLMADEDEEYLKILHEDYGFYFFPVYDRFSKQLLAFEGALTRKADAEYQAASTRNLVVQILIALIGIPTLVVLIIRLRKQEQRRSALLMKVDSNNKKFLFNHGDAVAADTEEVIEVSMYDLQKAAAFVTQISEGNYEVQWDDLSDQNALLNRDTLVGKLIQMREQMKKVKIEDEKRLWITEGLSKFSDIIRNSQHNLSQLTDQSTSFLVHYLKAQQGAIFVLKEDEEEKPFLEMISCYAFDRKKFESKRIYVGDGVVGQTFLEGVTTKMRQIPQGYTSITSGLGHATPDCLLVVPLKFNDQVKAIFEVASFHDFSDSEISFIEKAGEFIASAITSAENTERTNHLLEEFKVQAEQTRAQEEELRQNMEELEATQEEMKRKERELEDRLKSFTNQ